MFGTNNIEKSELAKDGSVVRMVSGSPFRTIQGEGPYAGHPAVFIRLHGCHLRCVFCDTEFDNPNDPEISSEALAFNTIAARGSARLVVITGGEPMRQNILPLAHRLFHFGFKVQIETAGTFWIDGIERYTEIVCSPKTPTIHPNIYKHATAFKYVISHKFFYNTGDYVPWTATQRGVRDAELARPRPGAPVYLSPCDEQNEDCNAKNRRLVADMAMRCEDVIAGLQLHKFLGVA